MIPECPRPHCGGSVTIHIQAGNGVPSLFQCGHCSTLFHRDSEGALKDMSSLLVKLALGDDKMRSAVSEDTAGTIDSIPQEFSRDLALIQDVLNGFGGRLTQRLGQLQGRLHYLHGQLAGAALAHPQLEALVETAKQALDLVAARPDGPLIEPPRGDAG